MISPLLYLDLAAERQRRLHADAAAAALVNAARQTGRPVPRRRPLRRRRLVRPATAS